MSQYLLKLHLHLALPDRPYHDGTDRIKPAWKSANTWLERRVYCTTEQRLPHYFGLKKKYAELLIHARFILNYSHLYSQIFAIATQIFLHSAIKEGYSSCGKSVWFKAYTVRNKDCVFTLYLHYVVVLFILYTPVITNRETNTLKLADIHA